MLEHADLTALIETCAPGVAPPTMLAIIEVESGFNALAIGVNAPERRALAPKSASAAVRVAEKLLRSGANLDLGLAQINSRNLARLNLTLTTAFDPCANLAAAAQVLRDGFDQATINGQAPQEALRTALSIYNTGHPRRGLRNGYVAKVVSAAERFGAEPASSLGQPSEHRPDTTGQSQGSWLASFVFRPVEEVAK